LSRNKKISSVIAVLGAALCAAAVAGSTAEKPRPELKKVSVGELNRLAAGDACYIVDVQVASVMGNVLTANGMNMNAFFATRELEQRSKGVLEVGGWARLTGRIGERGGRPVFIVEDFATLETELERLRKAVANLSPDNGMARIKLAEGALKTAAEARDAELESEAAKLLSEGVTIEESNADKKNPDDLVRVAMLYAEKMSEMSHTFRLLREALRLKSDHEGAIAAFRKLGAHFYQGRWVSREDFMAAEGFVLEGDEWISHAERRFRAAIEKRRAALDESPIAARRLRMSAEDKYRKGVVEHRILVGMTREEVAEALGYPEDVERRVTNGCTYDQWIYRDTHVYFENGFVCLEKEKP